MGPGSGAGATVGAAPPSVPVSDRWYKALETKSVLTRTNRPLTPLRPGAFSGR